MTTLFKKYSILLLIPFFLFLLILNWLFPSAGAFLGTVFLLLSILIACAAILQKHRSTYLQGSITLGIFLRNVLLEIIGAGLAMGLASLLGRTVATMATGQIGDELIRFVAGILIGLSMGIIVGMLIAKTWGRLVRA